VKSLKKKVGLWIDHTKAVIFSLANEGAVIKRISSELETNVRFSAGAQKESVEEHGDKRLTEHLSNYYDEVLSYIRDAESILIFGPGEAKGELKKRLESRKLHQKVVGFETVDKMTDNQIVTKVRQRFLK
jgi:stalled ribosome rescue protein Dom34